MMTRPSTQNFTPLSALQAVVLDTETTGLDASKDRVVQIGAIALKGPSLQADDRFETLVNPSVAIPPTSTAIHGIKDEDLAAAPSPGEALAQLSDFLKERVVIGHTIAFDLEILDREASASGQHWRPLRSLDVRPLALAVAPLLTDYSLDALCAWAGIENERRHSAMGDAKATAALYLHLLPLLREKNIRTLAEAEAVCRSVQGREAKLRGDHLDLASLSQAWKTEAALEQIDAYPFSTKVSQVMSSPPVIVPGATTLGEALKLLLDRKISSAFVEDDAQPVGIVTERDLLRALAYDGAKAYETPLSAIMSSPLQCVMAEDPLYRAIGRIERLNVRHLGVRDRKGDLVGAVTTRNLLRHRSSAAMVLGDDIEASSDESELGVAWSKVPALARSLLEQEVRVDHIANVISSEICALTKRAAVMAEEKLRAEGRGEAPHSYALLVLGSAGRGESLIAADQDNAIAVDCDRLTAEADAWFAELGAELSAILDRTGVVYCKGGVMAMNEPWRRSETEWKAEIEHWVNRQDPKDLLNVDIFFDAITVHGDESLGRRLWTHGFSLGARSPSFLRALEGTVARWRPPLKVFGGFKTGSDERLDLKMHGLFPIVAAARILSIKTGQAEHSTAKRLIGAAQKDALSQSTAEELVGAHRTILRAILSQQVIDAEQGRPPGSKVDPRILTKHEQSDLREAVRLASEAIQIVREGVI